MCGRFTLKTPADQFAEQFGAVPVEFSPGPRYNIAPTQPVATVLNEGRKAVVATRWGLIPSWSRDSAIGARLINARAESLSEKPSFRSLFRRQRCLILADGFYEWQPAPGRSGRIPFYIRLKSRQPFAFAGLWDEWTDAAGRKLRTSTIITTTANERVAPIHHRMPVILQPDHFERWLTKEETEPAALAACLVPYPAADMEAYAVSTLVNRATVDDAACIAPV